MEKIFSYAWKGKRGIAEETDPASDSQTEDSATPKEQPQETYVDDEQGLQRRHQVDTLLTVHFFGKKGTNELKFEGFRLFMENLQTEVLELEFHEFSKGIQILCFICVVL